jgi:prepilin-type N-terminal cleavage/methylation domain-containing protein
MKNLRTRKGFTILELLVVLIVVGILVAIAFPVFGTMLTKGRQASVDADVRNAAVEIAVALDDNTVLDVDGLVPALDAVRGKYANTDLSVNGNPGGFVVLGTHVRDDSVCGSYIIGTFTGQLCPEADEEEGEGEGE